MAVHHRVSILRSTSRLVELNVPVPPRQPGATCRQHP